MSYNFGFPDYCVFSVEDAPPKDQGITYLNLEKSDISLIKNLLELEGTTVSERDILFLTTGSFKNLVLDNRISSKNIEEVLSMRRAMNFLLEMHTKPLDKEIICEYNYLVNVEPKKRFSGELRKSNVRIHGVKYVPPDYRDLPRLWENMFNAVSNIEGHRNKAFSYLLGLSKSQFFIDGNKRTARLSALHELAYGGQAIISPEIDTSTYLNLLLKFYETSEKVELVEFLNSNLYSLYED